MKFPLGRFILLLSLATFLSASAGAQRPPVNASGSGQSQPSPTAGSGQPSASASQPDSPSEQKRKEEDEELRRKEQSQRILGVVPQFGVTSRMHAAPLTTGQKFRLFAKASFDPFEYVAAGLQAGVSQATDEFPGYGQGAAGYGKRYGASLADQVSSGFFSNFFWPTLLKEDPRYFRLGEGSFKHRVFYSLAQEFVCHTDNGGRSFAYENALGAFSAGGLSNVYYPQGDRGFGLTMSRSAIALLYGSAGGLIDEFWPDINRKLFHKHPKTDPPPGTGH